jgi:hypothetical protein
MAGRFAAFKTGPNTGQLPAKCGKSTRKLPAKPAKNAKCAAIMIVFRQKRDVV